MFGFTVSIKRKRKEIPYRRPASYCPFTHERCREDCGWMFKGDPQIGDPSACVIFYIRRHLRQIAQGLGVKTNGRGA